MKSKPNQLIKKRAPSKKGGSQVFTLKSAEHAYRVLIESMNEGALTLSEKGVILYSNQSFARMVKRSINQVLGTSIGRLLSVTDQDQFRPLLKEPAHSGLKIRVMLNADGGSKKPVQISIRCISKDKGEGALHGMVVTDMTESNRKEEILRTLTQRIVQSQEKERGQVAHELHDHITQLLCAVLVRCQTLENKLSPSDEAAKKETVKLRELLCKVAEKVEQISRNLRPNVLDELGLIAVLKDTCTEYENRTGLSVKLTCGTLSERLPPDTELTLYRILQETLRNIEKHAHAKKITVNLTKNDDTVQLTIKDNGIGFNTDNNYPNPRKAKSGFGLLSMSERAHYVGGVLKVKSTRNVGTIIRVRILLPPKSKPSTKSIL